MADNKRYSPVQTSIGEISASRLKVKHLSDLSNNYSRRTKLPELEYAKEIIRLVCEPSDTLKNGLSELQSDEVQSLAKLILEVNSAVLGLKEETEKSQGAKLSDLAPASQLKTALEKNNKRGALATKLNNSAHPFSDSTVDKILGTSSLNKQFAEIAKMTSGLDQLEQLHQDSAKSILSSLKAFQPTLNNPAQDILRNTVNLPALKATKRASDTAERILDLGQGDTYFSTQPVPHAKIEFGKTEREHQSELFEYLGEKIEQTIQQADRLHSTHVDMGIDTSNDNKKSIKTAKLIGYPSLFIGAIAAISATYTVIKDIDASNQPDPLVPTIVELNTFLRDDAAARYVELTKRLDEATQNYQTAANESSKKSAQIVELEQKLKELHLQTQVLSQELKAQTSKPLDSPSNGKPPK